MSHLFVLSATAGLVSVLAYFRVKGKTHVVLYHAKFSGMVLAIGALASLSWPLMLLRGRSTDYVFYCLTPFLQYAKHVVGMTWVFNQEKAVLEQRLVPGSVIVVNHQSALDAFGVVQLWKQLGRLRIVAKKSFQYLGPVGLIGNLADFVFIDRKKGSTAVEQMVASVEKSKLTDKAPLLVFPEGTRHHDTKSKSLLPFKKGAFIAAVKANVPIVPVVFSPYTNLDHLKQRLDPAVVNVTVLEPIFPCIDADNESERVDVLIEQTRSKMLETFQSQ